MATRFQRLRTHFLMRLTEVLADVGRHPKLKMTDSKPEGEITFERAEMTTQFKWYRSTVPSDFPPCSIYISITVDMA